MEDKDTYTIAQVADQLRVTTHTIRYYEKAGLITPGRRSGQRYFTTPEIEWLEIVLLLRNTGMPIKEIRELLALRMKGVEAMNERIGFFKNYRKELERQIESRHQAIEIINHKIEKHTRQLKEYEETRI